MAQAEVIGAVQHAAECIATSVDQILAGFLSSCCIHDRAIELLGNQCLWRFRAKVAQEDDQGVAAGRLGFLYCLQHIRFVLYGFLYFIERTVFFRIRIDDSFAAVF